MDNSTIFTKTAKGISEVAGKTKFLSRDFRKILKEVNGTTSLDGLKEKLKSFPEDKLIQVLNELVSGDYIREFISPLGGNTVFDFSSAAKLEDALTMSDFLRYEQEMRSKNEIADKIKADAEAQLQKKAEEQARRESEEKIKRAADAHAKRIADEKARNEEQARHKAQEKARQEGVIQAKKIAEEQARQKAQELARHQAEEKAQQEAEARARKKMEDQARRDAEVEAHRQAQIQAQKDAEDQERRKAEDQARKVAEEKARQRAQELARLEAEERAQREAEARARKKLEDQARRDAEVEAHRQAQIQAQKDAEDQARRQAEEQARKVAEEKARQRAQELARLEAEERAQREAEDRARKEAEIQARKEAEQMARLAAEAQVKKQADEKAQREAEIKSKKEAEELVRRAAEMQAKQIEAIYVVSEAAVQAQKDAEDNSELEMAEAARNEAAQKIADERKRAEQEEILHKQGLEQQKKAEKEAKKIADKAAKMEAQAEALRKSQEKKQLQADKQKEKAEKAAEKASNKRNEKRYNSRSFSFGKLIAVGLFLLIVAGFGLVHVISFDDKIQLIQHQAIEQFHQPVNIASVRFGLVPQPHWRLEHVSIGNEGQIKVPEVKVPVDLASLFNGRVTFKSIGLASPAVNEEGLGWLLFGKSQKGELKFGSVTATNFKFISSNINLPVIDAVAEIGEDGGWKRIVLDAADKTFHMEMQPRDNGVVQIELTADTYRVPFGSALVLDKFNAKATANRDVLTVTEFGASLYDGIVSGNAKLMWGSTWSLKGDLNARMIDAGKLLPSLLQSSKIEGSAKYAFQARTSDKLLAAPHFKGNFSVGNGTLLGVDLMSLLRSQNSGGKSNFAGITGAFNYENGRIQLRNMRLGAGMVSANGNSDVDVDKNLSGNFVVDLKSPNTQMRSNLALSGTLEKPSFHR
jgi:hypothetical protein